MRKSERKQESFGFVQTIKSTSVTMKYLVAGENNNKHNYRSVTLALFNATGSEIPLTCINFLFSTNLRLLLGISFPHLARLLATFCIFHILEKVPNTHGLGSLARTTSSHSAVITGHFEVNLQLVFTGF